MLKNYIHRELLKNLGLEPTPGQSVLLEELSAYISSCSEDEIFLIKGYAGTGKTTIVNTLVSTLAHFKHSAVLLAPTGRAAKVLSSYTAKPAFTIHKKIYRQKSGSDGLGRFVRDRNLHKNTFFIVDEASMIGDNSGNDNQFGSGNLLADLLEYVQSGNNCRLILIGDTAQLPPVKLDLSLALNTDFLRARGVLPREFELTDVVRQAMGSGILYNATALRRKIAEKDTDEPRFSLDGFADIERVGGAELVMEIENAYSRYGEDETIVISRSNKRANRFNEGIRNQILWREEELSIGDLLMVVRNNYYWVNPDEKLDFIANGDIVRLQRIKKYESLYDHRFADVILEFPDLGGLTVDARMLMDTLRIETASLPLNQQKQLFQSVLEDYSEESNQKKRIKKVIEDPYFNALQVKFSYAVTCHKAQGGQWKAVFIDPGFYRDGMMNIEYLRWLYTAFTRATEKLYLVNFPDSWFEEG